MALTYQVAKALSTVVLRTVFRLRVYGKEHVPSSGGCIIAMNHQSFLDPPLVGISAPREIFYLARKTLLEWPVLGPLFPKLNVIPVDQDRADMSALKTVIKRVKAGECTVIFPEGTRTHDGNLGAAQPGLGLILAKTRCTVIPARIFGADEAFPRKGRPHPFTRITMKFEAPVDFTDADFAGEGRELYQALSERVLARISQIETPRA